MIKAVFLQIYQILSFECVQFIVCQLKLNKIFFKKTKKIDKEEKQFLGEE